MLVRGKATGHLLFKNVEIDYTATATADYTYDPGCYRTANGDGWPPSEDYDDLEFEVEDAEAWDEEGNQVEITDEMWEACDKDAENLELNDVEWDEPEPDYPEPPDPDDWDWGND